MMSIAKIIRIEALRNRSFFIYDPLLLSVFLSILVLNTNDLWLTTKAIIKSALVTVLIFGKWTAS